MIVLSKFLHTAKNYWVRHNNCSSQQKKKKKKRTLENKRKEWLQRKTRWQRSSQMCRTSLSVDTSGIHLQMQISQNTSWEQTGVPDHWKGIYRSKTQQDKGRKGERGEWAGLDLHLGLGELKQGSDPQIEAIVWDTGEVFEAVGGWSSWSGTVWMEWEPDNPCCSRMYPGQGPKSPEIHSGWELEHRNWRAIPGWGLLLTAGRQPSGTWGRSHGGEYLWSNVE